MDYASIVNRSFKIAWRYKSLWIFGLFAGSGPNFNFNLPSDFMGDFQSGSVGGFSDLRSIIPPQYVLPLLVGIGLLVVFFVLAYCVCAPALIDGVNRVSRGGAYRFGQSFSAGVDNFLRFLGLGLLSIATGLTIFGVLVLIGIILFSIATGLGLISLLILIPVGLFCGFSIYNIFALAQRALVVRNVGISDALYEGWVLLWRNFGSAIIIFLITIGLTIAFTIAMAICFLIVGIPLGFLIIGTTENIWLFVAAAVILGLPFSLVIGGYLGAFTESLYTLFYFELVEPGSSQRPLPDLGVSYKPA